MRRRPKRSFTGSKRTHFFSSLLRSTTSRNLPWLCARVVFLENRHDRVKRLVSVTSLSCILPSRREREREDVEEWPYTHTQGSLTVEGKKERKGIEPRGRMRGRSRKKKKRELSRALSLSLASCRTNQRR